MKRLRPDLVLTYTIKPNIYGGLACRALHIPYAVNITGLGSAIENGGWLKRFVLTLYKPVLAGAKVVFFENAGNRDTLAATGVVPQGRDVVLNGAGVDFVKLIKNNLNGVQNTPVFGNYEENVVMMYDSVVITKLD